MHIAIPRICVIRLKVVNKQTDVETQYWRTDFDIDEEINTADFLGFRNDRMWTGECQYTHPTTTIQTHCNHSHQQAT